MKYNKGDLVTSTKGHLGIIVGGQLNRNDQYVDVFFCKRGVVNTGYHIINLRKLEVANESR